MWSDVNVYSGGTSIGILSAGNTITGQTLWSYDGTGYASSSELAPYEGYWVYNLSSKKVVLSVPSPLLVKPAVVGPDSRAKTDGPAEELPPPPPGGRGETPSGSGGGCFISTAVSP